MSHSKRRNQIPLSPTFAPRKLGFDNQAMNENTYQTPRSCSALSQINKNKDKNQENKAPPTPLSSAKDSQYKQWLQRNGFYQLFRGDSTSLSSVIKVLRLYSQEICQKVEIVLNKNNQMNAWRVEVGEPALERIKRYKLIESEWKKEQQTMTQQNEAKNEKLKCLKIELNDLQNQIKDIYIPKIKEYDRLLIEFNAIQKQRKNVKNECSKYQNLYSEQSKKMKEILATNKQKNEQINCLKLRQNEFKSQIAQKDAKLEQMNKILAEFECENEKLRNNEKVNAQNENNNGNDDDDVLDCNQVKITNLNRSVVEREETSLEFEFEAMSVTKTEQLPLQFHDADTSEFGWNFAMNEDNDDNDLDIAPKKIMKGISELSTKIDTICNLQKKSFDIVHKVHSEHDDMQKTLKLNLSQLNLQQNAINSSCNSMIAKKSLSNLNDADLNGINDKIDSMTNYLKTLKMDQRIMTVYKKIDAKLNDIQDSNSPKNANFEQTLISIQCKQESQQNVINNSLSLFGNELRQIIEYIEELKVSKNGSKSPSLFGDKALSPISGKNGLNDSSFRFDTNMMNAMDKMIDFESNRLNELMMNEFVLILTNNLCKASEQSFDKMIVVILKMMNNLFWFQLKAIYANICGGNKAFYFNNGQIESVLIKYKIEIDAIFNNLFQSTINNVIRELISDKMNRIKVQTKISKLTNRLQMNKYEKLTSSQNNKIKQQMSKIISFRHIYMPLFGILLVLLFIGMLIGYVMLPKVFQMTTTSYYRQHNHGGHHSFM